MLTKINCAKCIGIKAMPVTVEVDISPGIGIHIIGMPDTAIKESVMRVTTALKACGFRIPGHKIVVNLAPGDIRKTGTGYDLAIALGILISSGQIAPGDISSFVIMGELGLDGSLRSIPGSLPMARYAGANGFSGIILPRESAIAAAHTSASYFADNLNDVLHIISDGNFRKNHDTAASAERGRMDIFPDEEAARAEYYDFADISGQERAKRALEIAAAGGHNVLLIGTPGSGKSILAQAVRGIMPPMTHQEEDETSDIYSLCGLAPTGGTRPFRSPGRTITPTALLGGGSDARPGEVSLAHNGVLFLDEAAEMPARILDLLREPMENGEIVLSRMRIRHRYPCRFLLIAATNPCPCGYYGEGDQCRCTAGKIQAYTSRLSGPFLDRIDLKVHIHPVDSKVMTSGEKCESSAVVAARVAEARERGYKRFAGRDIATNSQMRKEDLDEFCQLSDDCRELCESIIRRYGLSVRGYHKLVGVARTIADLEGSVEIKRGHIAEAATYRTTGWHLH